MNVNDKSLRRLTRQEIRIIWFLNFTVGESWSCSEQSFSLCFLLLNIQSLSVPIRALNDLIKNPQISSTSPSMNLLGLYFFKMKPFIWEPCLEYCVYRSCMEIIWVVFLCLVRLHYMHKTWGLVYPKARPNWQLIILSPPLFLPFL